MKTMLIHNWVASFQKPTYFLEMEMSPRQMYIRHVQIRGNKKGVDKKYYKHFLNSTGENLTEKVFSGNYREPGRPRRAQRVLF